MFILCYWSKRIKYNAQLMYERDLCPKENSRYVSVCYVFILLNSMKSLKTTCTLPPHIREAQVLWSLKLLNYSRLNYKSVLYFFLRLVKMNNKMSYFVCMQYYFSLRFIKSVISSTAPQQV